MTGIELVAKERQEQIDKHGYTDQFTKDHPEYYADNQLVNVARGLMFTENDFSPLQLIIDIGGADGWNVDRLKYMEAKPYKDRLIIAAALIVAELDRINTI